MLITLASVLPYAFAATLSTEFPSIIGGLSGTIIGALLAYWGIGLSKADAAAARAAGLRIANEVYADRTYDDHGNLTPRSEPGAVIHDADEARNRVLTMLDEQAIRSTSGKRIPVRIDTICVHGDNPSGVAMARDLRKALEASGIRIAPFSSFVP